PSRIAWPAAVSHSLVGPKRGYTSIPPSAMRQNFSDEPRPTVSTSPMRAISVSVRGPRCERLAATCSGAAAGRRTCSACSPCSSRRNAPWPGAPCHSTPVTGAWITPNTDTPWSIRAMLTLNSPLRLMNSRVPSSGSTSHSRVQRRRSAASTSSAHSSDSTGTSGVSARNPSTMTWWAAMSADVTGDASSLRSTSNAPAYTSRMAAAAWRATSITPSRTASLTGMVAQVLADDEQRGDRAAFGEVLAQDQFVERIQLPGHDLKLLWLVAREPFGIQVACQHQVRPMAHVGGCQGELAQHLDVARAVPGLFLEFAIGRLLGRLARVDPALDQAQLVAVQAGSVFAHQQHRIVIKHGHHRHRAVAPAVDTLIKAALPVAELQVQLFHAVRARLVLADGVDDREAAAHRLGPAPASAGARAIMVEWTRRITIRPF